MRKVVEKTLETERKVGKKVFPKGSFYSSIDGAERSTETKQR